MLQKYDKALGLNHFQKKQNTPKKSVIYDCKCTQRLIFVNTRHPVILSFAKKPPGRENSTGRLRIKKRLMFSD